MSTSIMDYINVNAKMADLGCVCPTSGLALLPINFAAATSLEELRHAAQTSTVRKLMLQKGLPLCDIVERSQRPPYVKNKSSELVLPILYLSASFLSQNPALVTVALNVVSSYVYESLRHLQRKGEVRFDIVAEDQKRGLYRHISYKGPVDGLESLPDSIREAIK